MKKKAVNKKFRLLRLIIISLIIASSFIILLSLPVWRIKHIEVRGNSMTASELIKQKANISFNENIFFVNYREVTRRIMLIPQVKAASVSAKVPSTIVISVEERKPFTVFIVGGDYIVTDDEGTIIERIKSGGSRTSLVREVSKLPTVIGLPGDAVVSDSRIRPDTMSAIEGSFKLLGSFFSGRKFDLIMKSADDLSISVNDILLVKIGCPEDIEKKLRNLSEILKDLGPKTENVEYVDVRSAENPAVKFRK